MEELRPICVVQYGLGATGRSIARLIDQTPGMKLVGGIDQDPSLSGRDLGDVTELGRTLGVEVSIDAEEVLATTRPDVAIVATQSLLKRVYPQLTSCLQARVNVLSTCEELVYPYANEPELASSLNQLALRSNVTLLGVGVNPGFIMDVLPLMLTGPCTCVNKVTVTRVVDATLRRASLHQRIGAGLTAVEFREHMADYCNRHIGLKESLHMIADRFGWTVERIDEQIEPLLTDDWVRTETIVVAPNQVMGLHQVATGIVEGREALVLDWKTAVGIQETYDSIVIDGSPPINVRFDGGLHGDQAAAAMVLHAIRPTFLARCGLLTLMDIPPISYHVAS